MPCYFCLYPKPGGKESNVGFWIYLIFFLSASYSLSFGNLGPVSDFLWIEGMSPIMFVYACFNLVKERHVPLPYGSRVATTAIFSLLFVALAHYTFNPVSSQKLLDAGKYGGGIRAYYTILIGCSIFFVSLWYACYWTKQKTYYRKFLLCIFWVSLFIGYARLITFFLGIELPLLKGVFDYQEAVHITGRARRPGGLSDAATLGISALFALHYKKKWPFNSIFLLILGLLLMIMSGGRSATIGLCAALLSYFAIIQKKISSAILFTVLIAIFVFTCMQFEALRPQFERIANVGHGFEKDAPGRYSMFLLAKEIIICHPIIGKGIGVKYLNNNIPSFVLTQLVGGGHGSYLSILLIFGIVGLLFLIITLFGTIARGILFFYSKNRSSVLNNDESLMICFVVLELITLSFEFIAGGTGYNNLRLYLLAGIATGLFSRRKDEA